MWVLTDQNRLHWMENNQQMLHASLYSGLQDAVAMRDDNFDLNDIGRCVILPSSYVGGPRYMNQCFQDAMAVAQYYHGFDLFITLTLNLNWPKIKNKLLPMCKAPEGFEGST
jgi:Helitron helicase-like domain at N-terminus